MRKNPHEDIPKNDRPTTREEEDQVNVLAERIRKDRPVSVKAAETMEMYWWEKLLQYDRQPDFQERARELGCKATVEWKKDGNLKKAEVRDLKSGEVLYYWNGTALPEGSFGPETYREQG